MGIGNRTLPAIAPTMAGERGRVDLPAAFAKLRAAREAKNRPPAVVMPIAPIVDIGARVSAAQQAADRVRRRASGANTPPAVSRAAMPGINLSGRVY